MRLFSKGGGRPRPRGRARTARLRVELCEPRCLLAANQFLVTTNADTGAGSLRQAIKDANTYGAGTGAVLPTIIDFAISGSTTITLDSPLDAVKVPTLIDGTSQPTYQGAPLIQIDGKTHAIEGDGFDLAAGSNGSRVRGLDIYGFSSAIHVQSNNDTIQSNYLGADVAGTNALPNNFGVRVDGATGTTIGGGASVGNLISGNSVGVAIQGASSGTIVTGNQIGTNADGDGALKNTTAGIQITGSSQSTIGTTAAGMGNAIAFNPIGVDVVSGTGNAVRGNSIYANAQGILLNKGNGANDGQAPPTLTYATTYSGVTVVEGELPASFTSSMSYQVDFYASAVGDTATSDDARIFLGSTTVTTGSSGATLFTFHPTIAVPVGQTITATATDPAQNTSQFAGSAGFPSATSAEVVNPFVVTTISDKPGSETGLTSLRQAITNANADTTNPNPDTITFAIGTVPAVITLTSALPAIAHPVIIDATTQPGYAGAPVVEIDGAGLTANGLVLGTGSNGSTIKGLSIVHFGGTNTAAIDIESDGNNVQSNVLGTALDGTVGGNAQGVLVNGSNNTIGGASAGAGNTIANNKVAVDVNSGDGDTVRGNLIYSNTSAIVLQAGANNNQKPPTLSQATATSITGTVPAGTAAGTVLDFYADVPGQSPARVYLGNYTYTGSDTIFTAPLAVPIVPGQAIAATSTSPNGDTSAFSATAQVASPFVVTNTNSAGPGSLNSVIAAANASPPSNGTNSIVFNIPTTDPNYNAATMTFTINVATVLPAIVVPMTLDGTTESSYLSGIQGQPVTATVAIDGGGKIADGLVLNTGSGGSTIDALKLTHFAGDAIQIKTSDNTIGGNTPGLGNTIAGNSGAAVHVTAGSSNTIRQNLIYGNGDAIVYDSTPPSDQPTIIAAASVPNLTTIDYSFTADTTGTYTVEFYASSGLGGPAAQYLGSAIVTPTTTGLQKLTEMLTASTLTFDVGHGLDATQMVTATVTGPDNSTSEFFAGASSLKPAFEVTNTTDNTQGSFVGSLRLAILNANNNPGTDTITFNSKYSITPALALPVIVGPVTIDATSHTGTEIDGGGQPFSGLTLGTGSDGSTIEGLTVLNFGGGGIVVQSSHNTIGGTADNAGNTISDDTNGGVVVLSGTGNTITGNTYTGSNFSSAETDGAHDIVVSPSANGGIQPVELVSASLSGTNLLLGFTSTTSPSSLDVYKFEDDQRVSVGRAVLVGTTYQLSDATGVTEGDHIIVSQTDASGDTSAFSNSVMVASGLIVTNTQSSKSVVGSLAYVLDFVNNNTVGPQTIKFDIPSSDTGYNPLTGAYTISLSAALPDVRAGVTIDGTSQPRILAPFIGTITNGAAIVTGIASTSALVAGEKITGIGVPPETTILSVDSATQITLSVNATASGTSTLTAYGVVDPTRAPVIQIDGGGSDHLTISGLVLEGDDTIQGLSLFDFSGNGTAAIMIGTGSGSDAQTSNGNTIRNNWIGASPTLSAVPGNQVGILIQNGSTGNTIGGVTNTINGVTVPAANVIGMNTSAGVEITGSDTSGNMAGNLVLGNYFGTDVANDKLGNKGPGVLLDNASSNSIGAMVETTIDSSTGTISAWFTGTITDGAGNPPPSDSISALGNIFGFNAGPAISITNGSSDNSVMANWIGINGTRPAGGAGNGIDITGSNGNKIGETSLPFTPTFTGTAAFTLSSPLPLVPVLQLPSVSVTAGQPVSIGGIGNIITANAGDGIKLSGASNNAVEANIIGSASITSDDSVVVLTPGNSGNGINVLNGEGNTIGGAATVDPKTGAITALGAAANLIMGNALDGVNISGAATNMIVQGNLISQNTQNGVEVEGNLSGSSLVATITDNFIGTDETGYSNYSGSRPLGNGLSGILLEPTSEPSSLVSHPAVDVTANVIASNGLSGITVLSKYGDPTKGDLAAANVAIQSNLIGTDASGRNVGSKNLPSFGNVLDGIRLDAVAGVTVGPSTSVLGSTVSLNLKDGGNLISGNLGRGIELVDGAQDIMIDGNLIGVVLAMVSGKLTVAAQDANLHDTGNLSDGIFLGPLPDPPPAPQQNTISGNVISANRGYGIHATGSTSEAQDICLVIVGNLIGTSNDGSIIGTSGGNGADGIFLDHVMNVTIGGERTAYKDNLISCNRADGIDLLNSSKVKIKGNEIGTNRDGTYDPSQNYGNAGDGIFLNQSNNIKIGDMHAKSAGTLGDTGNIISGNGKDGVFISGVNDDSSTPGNQILGNFIGVGKDGTSAIPNSVSGIILSNSGGTAAGPGNVIRYNVISGNLLDGILLANNNQYNLIDGNRIGTDATGTAALGNGADGIFLIGGRATVGDVNSAGDSSIQNNTISNNVISGNNQNGVQIFGPGSSGNTVSDNLIGLGLNGGPVPNRGNGVYLNDAGVSYAQASGGSPTKGSAGNIVWGNTISGNSQSGVFILGGTAGAYTLGAGNIVQSNKIGTDTTGSTAIANGGNGVFIYGSMNNWIGGTTSTPGPAGGVGNLISGNAQAGVAVFSPAGSALATGNTVIGNLIGTNLAGDGALGNQSDGVDVFSGQNNIIGGPDGRNVISGNLGNGVLIAQLSNVPATGNRIAGNWIGLAPNGATPLGNAQNGVLVENASLNAIGLPSGNSIADAYVPAALTSSNVISANGLAGIQFVGNSPGNSVQGNYIGVSVGGTVTAGLGNAQSGVFVNSPAASSYETIGGTAAGAGNVIAGNGTSGTGYGIEILGSQLVTGNNLVQGNLIGIDVNGAASPDGQSGVYVQQIGVFVQNSSNNTIGSGNVISGNSQSGVEILGQFATGNRVVGNHIGTNIKANGMVGSIAPLVANGKINASATQNNGVYVLGSTNNTIGPWNVIGGNMIGVEIEGQAPSGSTAVPPGGNTIVTNWIGTNSSNQAVSNYEYGVLISNSASNTIGGAAAGQGNWIGANGIAGVEIFGGTPQNVSQRVKKTSPPGRNIVINNQIGMDLGSSHVFYGQSLATPDGPIIELGAQLYGVAVIGSSSNRIGVKGTGNRIAGNTSIGVYITRRDFPGSYYSVPTNNVLYSNVIANNGQYGVLRYEAPGNAVAERPRRFANRFSGNPINISDYTKSINSNTHLNAPPSKFHRKRRGAALPGHHKKKAHHAAAAHHQRRVAAAHHQRHATARPRVPALFRPGAKLKVIAHVPAYRHR